MRVRRHSKRAGAAFASSIGPAIREALADDGVQMSFDQIRQALGKSAGELPDGVLHRAAIKEGLNVEP